MVIYFVIKMEMTCTAVFVIKLYRMGMEVSVEMSAL